MFSLVAGELGQPSFADARVAAEREARRRAWDERRATEVSLDEIYALLPGYGIDAEGLKALECAVEQSVCLPNPEILELYQHVLRRGRRVVFASDMYLPEPVIRSILERCGYGRYDRLFLSSTLGVTKATGELFAHMIGALAVTPWRILHVGDNAHSDVRAARRAGLCAWHYVHPPAPSEIRDVGGSLVQGQLAERRRRSADGFWERLGYEHIGPLYLAFAQWLRDQVLQSGAEHVYFFARDGWIMKQVFDRVAADGPPTSYLYASRRALNVPAIEALDEDTLDFLVSGTTSLTVAEYLSRIGLEPARHEAAVLRLFASLDQPVRTGDDYRRLRELFCALRAEILAVAARERELALRYLAQEKLLGLRRAAVVDLGWHGTLQRSLGRLIRAGGAPLQTEGYYLGTFERALRYTQQGERMRGFLVEHGRPGRHERLIRTCVELFEFAHVAPHGSVLGFEARDNLVRPVLAPHDADAVQLTKAQRLQRGALAFVEDLRPTLDRFAWLRISAEGAASNVSRLLERPTRLEAAEIGDLTHVEGFGSVHRRRYIARPPDLPTLLRRPSALLEGLHETFWKPGYKTRILGSSPAAHRMAERAYRVLSAAVRLSRRDST